MLNPPAIGSDTRQFIYHIDETDRIVSVNDAFLVFASENNVYGSSEDMFLRRSIWNFISGDTTKHLLQLIFARVRKEQQAVELPFRCDSPTRRRRMLMRISPHRRNGLQFCNWITGEEERAHQPFDPFESRATTFLLMCSWCKRVLVHQHWCELEAALTLLDVFSRQNPPAFSHGVCPECMRDLEKVATAELK